MLTNKYRILMQLYETRSTKAAAEKLSYSQSAVSQALLSIENDLGVKLFIRRKNGLHTTNEGEQLYSYIKRIYDAENALKQDVSALKGMMTGEIRIGTYHTVACSILPTIIKEFKELYPTITFSIKEGDNTEVRSWLENDRINFGIVSITDNEIYHTYDLVRDRFYAVLPENDPEASRDHFDITRLQERDYIHLTEYRDQNDIDVLADNTIQPKTFCTVDQYETIAAMVEHGIGVGILPKLAIPDYYNIAAVPLRPTYYRRIGILVSERQLGSIAVATFIDFMRDRIK